MATADVAALYTVISHHHGFKAVEFYLQQDPLLSPLQKDFIMDLLRFATSHNYFWFWGDFFLQISDVAMGAKFAPSLANLFMAYWETETIDIDPRKELQLWKRYIDEVILIWEGDVSLESFLLKLNQNDRGIVLQHEASDTEIHFLDLNITVKGRLNISTFFKDTDRNAFIPVTSCHHKSWLAAVPKGQFQHIRCNCTEVSDFYQQATMLLKQGFLKYMMNLILMKP